MHHGLGGGAIDDASGLTIGATYAGQYAYVADGRNGLRVVKLIDTSTPGFYGWAPAPTPQLIASFPTAGRAAKREYGYQSSFVGRLCQHAISFGPAFH